MQLRCLIVDDSSHFREAAKAALGRDGLQVVGLAADSAEAVSHIGDLDPEVVLIDIDLGGESGFELARQVARQDGPAVILVSTHEEEDYADLIEQSPALGFISKSTLSASAVRALYASAA
jgi:DNA-binding NarL/FixJ family response regulator